MGTHSRPPYSSIISKRVVALFSTLRMQLEGLRAISGDRSPSSSSRRSLRGSARMRTPSCRRLSGHHRLRSARPRRLTPFRHQTDTPYLFGSPTVHGGAAVDSSSLLPPHHRTLYTQAHYGVRPAPPAAVGARIMPVHRGRLTVKSTFPPPSIHS